MKGIYEYTSLARPVNLKNSSNLTIVLWTAIFFLIALGIRWAGGITFPNALIWAAGAFTGVFFTWALGRDLDPDQPASALIAAALFSWSVFNYGYSGLLILILWMLACRMLIRTTGVVPLITDSFIIFLPGAILVLDDKIIAGLILAMVFVADAVLKTPLKRQWPFGVALLLICLLAFMTGLEEVPSFNLHYSEIIGISIIALIFLYRIAFLYIPKTRVDTGHGYLSRNRLRWAQIFTFVLAAATTLTLGKSGLIQVMPLWCTMAAIGLVRFVGR